MGAALLKRVQRGAHDLRFYVRSSDHTMPSPGSRTSGMAGHKSRCGWAWRAGCGIPPKPLDLTTS
jgi:hypothetical protein